MHKRPKKSAQKTLEECPKDLRRVPNRPKPNRPKKSVQKTKDDCPKDQRIVPKRPKKSAEKTKARRVPNRPNKSAQQTKVYICKGAGYSNTCLLCCKGETG